MNENGYSCPFLAWDSDFQIKLKEALKKEFETEIAWLEITRNVSVVHISFNDKRYGEVKEYQNERLIATK